MITKPLLAATLDPKDVDKIKYPVLCSPKLDGIRALMIDGKLVSRNFKPIPNKFIRSSLENVLGDGFDGELVLSDSSATFQEISSAVMSHEGEPDFVYSVFDLYSEGEFCRRLDRLAGRPELEKYSHSIRFIEHKLIHNAEELMDYEERCLELNYEGVMIRSLEGRYKCGRSTLKEGILLKLKRFEDSEAVIIGFEEKQKNNNTQERNELGYAKRSTKKEGMVAAGTLGNFLVRDLGTGITFSIGSGLDDSLRDTVWSSRDLFLGKTVKYKSLKIGVKEKPRHPVFLGFRHEIDL